MNPKTLSPLAAAAAAAFGLAASVPASASTVLPFDATVFLGGSGAPPAQRCAGAFTIGEIGATTTHSNLGSFVYSMSECIHPPPPTTTYDGMFDFVFANGSFGGTSYSIISSTAVPAVFNLDGVYTITHGTGAFAGATGSLTQRGQLDRRDFPPATAMLTLVGSVAMVPEPSTYGLLLAGLGVIGFVSRRGSRGAGTDGHAAAA